MEIENWDARVACLFYRPMTNSLTIYGHPASQPSRTVFWACLLHDLPFTLGSTVGPAVNADLTNPRGQVPWIVDDGFALAEMPAIVCYLADKHGWDDVYPKDLQSRALIQQFLHMHHGLVRHATIKLMAPHVMKPLDFPRGQNPLSMVQGELLATAFASDDPLADGGQVVHTIIDFLERHYFNDAMPFICGTQTFSVADLACYAEIGQLQFANLFDFENYPRTKRWLAAMVEVPQHDTIQAYNLELGDIATSPNTRERFAAASEAGFAALRETGLVT